MSYSPPTGNAVIFQLNGGYSPPSGGAIAFQFEVKHQVQGFYSASFGIPAIPFVAQGFSVTQFATPSAKFNQITQHIGLLEEISFGTPVLLLPCLATGFSSTQFGTPLLSIGAAYSWKATSFGTPTFSGVYKGSSEGWTDTSFGWARLLTNAGKAKGFGIELFGQPSARVGWLVTQFGSPRYVTQHDATSAGPLTAFGTPSLHRFYSVSTLGRVAIFGSVYSPVPQSQQAYGGCSTQFGTAKSSRSQRVSGFSSGQFGTPRAALSARSTSLRPTKFGTPLSARRQMASGFCQLRFGVPLNLFIDTYTDRYLPSLSVCSRTNRLDVWTEL